MRSNELLFNSTHILGLLSTNIFSPWERHGKLICYQDIVECEAGDIPYYPVRRADKMDLLNINICRGLKEKILLSLVVWRLSLSHYGHHDS